ncbi:UDP-N-acetylglucosamine 2-epimerase [Psychrobacillus sp. NPDC096623]|uniref:UDP-N-acetylglucosamine 2-epimerase n=1 Tax=Psychrobacillus sp. NPDC096623 TaxID=3364492 RepID=UPI0037FBB432
MKKILFLTGTRADYGKIKSLMKKVKKDQEFELFVFVTGMHMLSKYGSTWREIEKDGFKNVYHYINQTKNTPMEVALSNTIQGLSNYVLEVKPDMIVIHGDRLEALAGAIVGAFNNILVVHIEGGEVSGTIDESIRHAVTKLAHIHMVSNTESKKRIIQLGENEENIFVIGSPDIDIMHSVHLPDINKVKARYDIPFDRYAIVMYHPVTTEIEYLSQNTNNVVQALIKSEKNFVVIYPNNDLGNEFIINSYKQLDGMKNFKVFPSIRFEYFLTLMKHADFMIGNSSAGIRESIVYGTPSIDIGSRQKGRYVTNDLYIQHVDEMESSVLNAIQQVPAHKEYTSSLYGEGQSAERFIEILKNNTIWNTAIQKRFADIF